MAELLYLLLFVLGAAAGFCLACWWLTTPHATAYRRGYRAGLDRNPNGYSWATYFEGLVMLKRATSAERYAEQQLRRCELMIAAQLPPYLHNLSK